MRSSCYFGIVLLAAVPGSVLAVGFPGDIAPYPVDGQIVTGGYNHYTAPPFHSDLERVFLYEFAQTPLQPSFITDPGFDNVAPFATLKPGEPLGFQLTTNLLYWNGVGSVSFSPAPDPATLALSLGSLQTVIDGDSATGNFSTIFIADINGRLHQHVGSTIANGSPEGIYLIGMTLNMPGFTDSKPFYILYNDLQSLLLSDESDFLLAEGIGQEAASWVQDHVDSIPEPSSLFLAAAAAMALIVVARCRLRNRGGAKFAARTVAR